MAFPQKVLLEPGADAPQPYLVRIAGWSEERYFREAPENRFVEFEDGEIIVHSPVNIRHQQLALFLTMLLRGFVRYRQLGEVLSGPAVLRLRPGLDYEPDIFFISRRQQGRLAPEYFSGTPDLIVEILSPGTRSYDLKTKASAYRDHRVPEYWAVDSERKVVVRHLRSAGARAPYRVSERSRGRLQCRTLPGFWIDVSWLWREPLPDEIHCLDQILGR